MSTATESLAESGDIETLGPLFKLAEVFLWDRAAVTMPEPHGYLENLREDSTSSRATANINSRINLTRDEYKSVEDIELTKQMDALGLPISFSTSKQKNSVASKGKKKGLRAKSVSANKEIENRFSGSSRSFRLEDNSSSRVLHDSTNICDNIIEGEIDVSEDRDRDVSQFDRESLSVSSEILDDVAEKQCGDNETDVIMSSRAEYELLPGEPDRETSVSDHCEEGLSMSCYITEANNDDHSVKTLNLYPTSMESSSSFASTDHHVPGCSDTSVCGEFGDWKVIWDPFYQRNYFYNVQSQESTWYPPPGLEHFALCSNISNSSDTAEEHSGIEFVCDAVHDIDLHRSHDQTSLFQEKEDKFEYLNQSSVEVISYGRSDELTANSGSVNSNGHAIVTETADEPVSLKTATDDSTVELDVNECWEKQEKHLISSEACSVHDVPLELVISSSSLSATINGGENGDDECDSSNKGVTCSVDELDSNHEISSCKKKRRVRRLQSQFSPQGVDDGLPANIVKYWCQRYLLFSHFDNGIKMDEEGWFSVTPESIARHHASRCGSGTIIDCFTGVGGNAIQFAMRSNHVIAVDIDPQKIDYAQHNAAIYGVSDRINFIKGNFFQIASCFKADVIFMSPPWGGPDYSKVQTYDINTMLQPRDGQYLFEIARRIAPRVVMFLPRNVDMNQLVELSQSVDPPWALEAEKNFLNGRLKAITAYFDSPMS